MKCPFCEHLDTRVINSRPAQGGDSIRRRRECPKCGERFTTFEVIERAEKVVVKRDGKRVPFNSEQLRSGVQKACSKRPVTMAQIDILIARVEKEAFRNPAQVATTDQLGRLVLKRLKDIDKVAYIRFASVYKQFQDLQEFNTEIKTLLKD